MAGLGRYLIRRTITFIPTIFGVLFLTFIVAFAMPADPARAWAGGQKARPEVIQAIRKQYHLDDPWYVTFYYFIRGIITNKIISPFTRRPVLTDIMKYLPITLNLTILSMIMVVAMGIPFGILAALKKDTAIDSFVRILALLGYSLPTFWFAYLCIWIFYRQLEWIALVGLTIPSRTITGFWLLDALILGEFDKFIGLLRMLFLPSFVIAFASMGGLARYVRNTMLDVLSAEFIEFCRAKGIPPFWMWKHALKNSLIPVVTILVFMFAGLLCGAVITETVFNLPGLGWYTVHWVLANLDLPALFGITFFSALLIVIASLIVDILYAIIDPRIRF